MRAVVVMIFGAAALVVAGCGSEDGGVEPDQWVREICDLATDYDEDAAALGDDVEAAAEEGPAELQHAFLEALDGLEARLAEFREQVSETGPPDIERGEAVFGLLMERFDDAEDRIAEARPAVEGLDPEDAAFEDELVAALAELESEHRFEDEMAALAEEEEEVERLIGSIEDDSDCAAVLFPEEEDEPGNGGDNGGTDGDGAAGGDATPTDTWVQEVCGHLVALDTLVGEQTGRLARARDNVQVQRILLALFEGERELLEDLGATLDALGPPDVPPGVAVLQLVEERQSLALQAVETQVLPAIEALNPLSPSFDDDLDAAIAALPEPDPLAEELARLDGAEPVLAAIEEDPECALVLALDDTLPAPDDPEPPVSGDDVVPPDVWVREICIGIGAYVMNIEELVAELEFVDAETIEELKAATVAFVDEVVLETDVVVFVIRAQGVPDVPDGLAIARAVEQLFTELGDAAVLLRDGIADLPTDDPDAFVFEMELLFADFEEAADRTTSVFDALSDRFDTAELDKLFTEMPECAGF